MLLAVDIGNTAVTLAVLKRGRVVKIAHADTTLQAAALRRQLKVKIKALHRKYPALDGVVICSVVPKVLKMARIVIKQEFRCNPLIIGRDIIVPIKNRYRNPSQVGQDRLVCAFAAMYLYGTPAIVIDLGTAITFDIVSRNREYLGGIIVPGISLSAETLFQKTALLPMTVIRKPRALVGKDTKDSILSGLFYGYGAMIQGLITELARKSKGKPKVIVTGGYTRLMKKYIAKKINVIDDNLILKGMSLLWEGRS